MWWSFKRARSSAVAVGITATLCLVVSACSSSGGSSSAKSSSGAAPQQLTTLTISEQPYNGLAATQLGQQMGIFAHYGLNIKLVPASTVAVITAQVQSGQTPLGYTVTPIMVSAIEKGIGVRCVAPVYGQIPVNPDYSTGAIVVAADSPITSLKQLEGKTLGLVALAGQTFLTANQFVTQAGGTFSAVKATVVPFADMTSAVSSGVVTAAFEISPFIETGLAAGKIKILQDVSDNPPGLTGECYMSSNSYIADHADIISRFVMAQDQSILFAAAHPDDANAQIPTVAGVPASALKGTLPPKVAYSADLKPDSLVDYEKWMQTWGGLTGAILPVDKLAYVPADTPMTKLLFDDKGKYIGK